MSNDGHCTTNATLRTSQHARRAHQATVRTLEAQIVSLESQVRQLGDVVTALLADVATLEAACSVMRRRLAGRPARA